MNYSWNIFFYINIIKKKKKIVIIIIYRCFKFFKLNSSSGNSFIGVLYNSLYIYNIYIIN